MRRLLPEPAETSVAEQLRELVPAQLAPAERPYVLTNFAVTVDGHATIEGRAGPIGSRRDLQMLMGLRSVAEAVLVGAGTIRAERYGRLLPDADLRREREGRGLAPDPLAVLVSNSMALPWDAGLFSSGEGEVMVFTGSDAEPPETETPLTVIRHDDTVDLASALGYLRRERGIRALLCEGGPHLHGELIGGNLVDELFVTFGSKLAGGAGPGLLEDEGELFARYAVRT